MFAVAFASLAVMAAAGHRTEVSAQSDGPAPNSVEFYKARVLPIFQANCYNCHGGMNRRGGFAMSTRDDMYRGGKDGAVLVPGHPEQSILVTAIRHEGTDGNPKPMPPRNKLSDAEIAVITSWVKAGAVMPGNTP